MLSQLRMGARQANNALLVAVYKLYCLSTVGMFEFSLYCIDVVLILQKGGLWEILRWLQSNAHLY